MNFTFQRQGFRASRRPAKRFALLSILAFSSLAAVMVGCASPGIPRPPSLHLPATVTDLSALRIGDRVELHWTAPTRTTDGLELEGSAWAATTVEICRDPLASGSAKPNAGSNRPAQDVPCTAVARAGGHPGASDAVDLLPPDLTAVTSRDSVLAYRVRVLNRNGRSAGPSARVMVPAGPSIPAVEAFRAAQSAHGVVVTWRGDGEGTVEVLRSLVADPAQPALHRSGASLGPPAARRARASALDEVHLRAEPAESGAATPGMLDTTALPDATYRYRAQRVRSVRIGREQVVVRGEPTAAVQLALRDTFAPEPPTGLASVPAFVRSSGATSEGPAIDLSWQPNTEADLAGYYIYRVERGPVSPGTRPRRLTHELLRGPAYRDPEVLAGQRYEYRVTAVDEHGNESKPGAPVVETAPDPR